MARWAYACAVIAILLLSLLAGAQIAFAETQTVIDPTELPAAPPAPEATEKRAVQAEAAAKRERMRAMEAERKRARAGARAAEQERATAAREAREAREAVARAAAAKEAAARDAARRTASARAAATRAAAAKATAARTAAERDAVARELAHREAERELAEREAAREAEAKQAAAREAAQKEAAGREAAARDAARQAAAREAIAAVASKLIASREGRSLRVPPRFGTVFRDCADCPEMVWLPPGETQLGEAAGGRRNVATVDHTLAVGRFEVTFAEWDACVAAGECRRRARDSGWGRGRQPVIDISWSDARQYTTWLSRKTGRTYRLLTETEWEYAARAGTDARYWWGNEARAGFANCNDCGTRWDGRRPAPVGSFAANPFGLYDMNGNVWEWVDDCSYDCAPGDVRVVRGGAWQGPAHAMHSAARSAVPSGYHDNRVGFRVARVD